ncbi:tyrosine-type recombinase/integrase [Actinoallomurus purpureus]|uniref:tyrosine-type recombinase/integrase n=1 Tax=Actinoallomurus purpureus TaxID=478114 RepID=UPI003555FF97
MSCHKDGSPYTGGAVRRRFRKITVAAGIGAAWTPRELRHTFVLLTSDHAVPTQRISDLVGHKNTQDHRDGLPSPAQAGDPGRR